MFGCDKEIHVFGGSFLYGIVNESLCFEMTRIVFQDMRNNRFLSVSEGL